MTGGGACLCAGFGGCGGRLLGTGTVVAGGGLGGALARGVVGGVGVVALAIVSLRGASCTARGLVASLARVCVSDCKCGHRSHSSAAWTSSDRTNATRIVGIVMTS